MIHPALMRSLASASWPDNIRGLRFTVQRLMIESAPAPVIGLEHCTDELAVLKTADGARARFSLDEALAAARQFTRVTDAARHCGVSRTTMYRYLAAEKLALATGPKTAASDVPS